MIINLLRRVFFLLFILSTSVMIAQENIKSSQKNIVKVKFENYHFELKDTFNDKIPIKSFIELRWDTQNVLDILTLELWHNNIFLKTISNSINASQLYYIWYPSLESEKKLSLKGQYHFLLKNSNEKFRAESKKFNLVSKGTYFQLMPFNAENNIIKYDETSVLGWHTNIGNQKLDIFLKDYRGKKFLIKKGYKIEKNSIILENKNLYKLSQGHKFSLVVKYGDIIKETLKNIMVVPKQSLKWVNSKFGLLPLGSSMKVEWKGNSPGEQVVLELWNDKRFLYSLFKGNKAEKEFYFDTSVFPDIRVGFYRFKLRKVSGAEIISPKIRIINNPFFYFNNNIRKNVYLNSDILELKWKSHIFVKYFDLVFEKVDGKRKLNYKKKIKIESGKALLKLNKLKIGEYKIVAVIGKNKYYHPQTIKILKKEINFVDKKYKVAQVPKILETYKQFLKGDFGGSVVNSFSIEQRRYLLQSFKEINNNIREFYLPPHNFPAVYISNFLDKNFLNIFSFYPYNSNILKNDDEYAKYFNSFFYATKKEGEKPPLIKVIFFNADPLYSDNLPERIFLYGESKEYLALSIFEEQLVRNHKKNIKPLYSLIFMEKNKVDCEILKEQLIVESLSRIFVMPQIIKVVKGENGEQKTISDINDMKRMTPTHKRNLLLKGMFANIISLDILFKERNLTLREREELLKISIAKAYFYAMRGDLKEPQKMAATIFLNFLYNQKAIYKQEGKLSLDIVLIFKTAYESLKKLENSKNSLSQQSKYNINREILF